MGKIIALTGLAGSGKSTVAELIGAPYPAAYTVEVAFAAPLKRFCGEVFGFTHEELYGPSEARERPSPVFRRPNGEPLTARYALQTLGTEWGRNCDPDVWAKAGIRRAQKAVCWDVVRQEFTETPVRNAVITDLRFVNEARLVREAGGEVWRVDRPGLTRGNHPSELEIWCAEMDRLVTREISNTGTLEHLAATVRSALADST